MWLDCASICIFLHFSSLFPQLTLRQRLVAQQEPTAPHTVTSLNTQLPVCSGCPHCQADVAQIVPWGWSRGLRRYRCKQCLRSSTVLTKTPLARLRKAQCWEDYAQAIIKGLTVRKAALRCGVSKTPLSSGVTVSCAQWQLIKQPGRLSLDHNC